MKDHRLYGERSNPPTVSEAAGYKRLLSVIYKNFSRDDGTGTGSASGTLIGLVTGMVAKIPSLADRLDRLKIASDALVLIANTTITLMSNISSSHLHLHLLYKKKEP